MIGRSQRKHINWFDENNAQINQLSPPISFEPTPQPSLCGRKVTQKQKAALQCELRDMKTRWWSNISAEVECAFCRQDSKQLYSFLRQVFGSPSSSVVPVKSDGATVIKDPQGIMRRWKDHFADLFFNPSVVVDDAAIDSIPQTDLIEELDDEPTRE